MSAKVVIIIAAALIFIMGVMGTGFFFMWQKMSTTVAQIQTQGQEDDAAEEEEVVEEDNTMGPIYKMDTMIVNLADQGGKRYLRITMELEMSTPELTMEIETRRPQLRDAILMIIPTKQYADIGSTEGKILLRDELIVTMNGILKTGTIITIYFSEFVVQ